MTKQEKDWLDTLHRQLQQSLEYLHCGRVDDGRIVAEIVERELGKLVNKQKTKQALVAFFIGWDMKTRRMVATIKMKWWVPYYVECLHLFSLVFLVEPNPSIVSQFIVKHGITINTRFEEI